MAEMNAAKAAVQARPQVIVKLNMKHIVIPAEDVAAEYEVGNRWRRENILEHLFLQQREDGTLKYAIIILNVATQKEAEACVDILPFKKHLESVEYIVANNIY